ncbi:MAG: PAS domain S-box protein [Balneolaceae bacterium]|nr:PAS domain S-box protein [Balneolaceae bacterium]
MSSDYQKELKELSRDEKSYRKLRELFEKEQKARKTAQTRLDLLEGAIRSDYDSILITELSLEEPGPRIVYVNDGFCEMTGYDRKEVIGKTPRLLQGPKTDRAVLDKLKRRLKEGKSFFGQTVNYRKDGSEFVNQWDIHPLADRQGNITHWVSYQHDITERKRSERVLIDAETEFDDLREASRSTVLDVDVQGNIVMANKAFRELTGYTKDELKKSKAWELFPDKFNDSLKKRFDRDDPSIFEGQQFKGIVRHKSGVPVQVEGRTRVLELADQTLIRATVQNISLRKRIMETLDRRNEDFSRIFDRASEFIYEAYLEDGRPVVTYLSEEFPELTGLAPEKILGEGCLRQYVHEDDYEKVCRFLRNSVSGGSTTCQYRIQNRGGEYIQVIDYCKASGENGGIRLRGAVSLKPEEASAGGS